MPMVSFFPEMDHHNKSKKGISINMTNNLPRRYRDKQEI
jgi:hypothetical protein